MAWSRKDAVVFGLSLSLAAVLVFRVQGYLRIYDVQPGDRAPEFDIVDDQGIGVSLRNYEGKIVLLNFWATWCAPCVREIPSLNRIYKRFEDKGFVVLAVSVDENKDQYREFLADADVAFPTVRDPQRTVSGRYGTAKYPESYLIDRGGRVLRKYVGAEDWLRPEIVNYIRSLL